MPTITLQGRRIEYSVTRSRRSRYVRLTITLGKGLRVSAPLRVPERELPSFIHEKSEWVLRKLDEFERIERHIPHPSFRSGSKVLLLGRELVLRVHVLERQRSRVQLAAGELHVTIPSAWNGERREEIVARILTAWYGVQARKAIPARVAQQAGRMGLAPGRITIRRQRSRWGSCSASGNLNFNQTLMLLPTPVIDYVIVHELAHMVHLNHSPVFWRLVEKYCPDRKLHQKWLRAHSYYLDC